MLGSSGRPRLSHVMDREGDRRVGRTVSSGFGSRSKGSDPISPKASLSKGLTPVGGGWILASRIQESRIRHFPIQYTHSLFINSGLEVEVTMMNTAWSSTGCSGKLRCFLALFRFSEMKANVSYYSIFLWMRRHQQKKEVLLFNDVIELLIYLSPTHALV